VKAGIPAVSSSTEGSCGWTWRCEIEIDVLFSRGMTVPCRRIFGGGSLAPLESEKGTTPALLAISCSPSCQCMASAARHGMAISSATFAHISALNLMEQSSVSILLRK
jgi:hypothetical protein